MDKGVVVHICNGISLSHKKEQIGDKLRWMNLESILESEAKEKEKKKYINTYLWNLEK